MDSPVNPIARWRLLLPLGLILAAFIVLASWHLDRPGWYADEMLFVQAALPKSELPRPAMSVWHGIPIRVYTYIGALKAWIYTPIFAVFGLSPTSMRLPAILLSAMTLIVTFFSTRRWLGKTAALAVVLLCAVNPSFVMQSRVDWGPVVLMWLCKAVAMALLFQWLQQPRLLSWNLAGCLLVLALGFFDKYNFIWIIVAYGLATMTVYFRECRQVACKIPRPVWIALAVCLLAAGWLVKSVVFGLVKAPDLSQIGQRLGEIWDLYVATNNGVAIGRFWFHEQSHSAEWTGGAVWQTAVALFFVVVLQIWRKKKSLNDFFTTPELRLALWCLSVWSILFLEIVLTPQAGGPHHLAVLFPFDLLAAVSLATYLWRANPTHRPLWKGVSAAGTVSWLICCGIGLAAFYPRLANVEAYRPTWSPRMNNLARFLGKIGHRYDRIEAVDWGFDKPLQAIVAQPTRSKIESHWPTFLNWTPAEAHSANKINRLFPRNQEVLYILHREDGDVFPACRTHFIEMNRLLGNRVVPLSGVPREVAAIYELYTVKRP